MECQSKRFLQWHRTNQHIVVMHVFRPSNTSSVWQVDVAQVSGIYAAPAAPRTVTIPGITTITDGALVFAAWASSDNNTWGSLTAGWSTPGSAQYRNNQQFISNPCLQGHTTRGHGDCRGYRERQQKPGDSWRRCRCPFDHCL